MLYRRIQRTHFTQPLPLALSIIIYSLPKWCGEVHFYQNTFPVTSWETLIFLILITFLLTVCLSTVSFSWNRSVLAWPFNYFPLPETLNVRTVKAKKHRFLGKSATRTFTSKKQNSNNPFSVPQLWREDSRSSRRFARIVCVWVEKLFWG